MGVTESHLLALPGDTLAEDDAEWMPGKSRTRLAPDLDKGFLMDASVKSTAGVFDCAKTASGRHTSAAVSILICEIAGLHCCAQSK